MPEPETVTCPACGEDVIVIVHPSGTVLLCVETERLYEARKLTFP